MRNAHSATRRISRHCWATPGDERSQIAPRLLTACLKMVEPLEKGRRAMRILVCGMALIATLAGCSKEQVERFDWIDDCRSEAERKGRYLGSGFVTPEYANYYVLYYYYEWTRASEAYFATCTAALPPPRPKSPRNVGETYSIRSRR
jgi:hypothetical protein